MSDLSRVSRRKGSKPNPRPKKRRSHVVLYLIAAVFFAMIFFGFKMADAMFAPVTKANTGLNEVEDASPDQESSGPYNILIIGTDERDDEPSRSDTLILATLFPEEKQVKLLFIPRDTRVKIPGRKDYDKITHAHAYGGVDLTRQTVEDYLGLDVDYYIKVNFQGFKNIIDILGGVTLDVEKRMDYPAEEIDLEPGLQKLNGHDALAYVRFRSDGLGDIGRVERQQKFLAALTDHLKSFATLPKVPSLIKEVHTHIKTNLNTKDILYFATKFINIDHENIQSIMVPGRPDTIDGISYWLTDIPELDKILDDMQSISEE
ncbi:MAG: LCP family protein [Peptococcaceae bacterium]